MKSCGFGILRDWQLLNLRDIFENTSKYLLFLFQMLAQQQQQNTKHKTNE